MDRNLIDKYFRDQCSEDELEQVLSWFQTDEGQEYLEQDINQQNEQLIKNSDLHLYPEIESEALFNRIQLSKKNKLQRRSWFFIRVASILLVATMLSSLLYWSGITTFEKQSSQPTFVTYVTEAGQQNILRLADGTVIRLNEESTLVVPTELKNGKRNVRLKGEAYFEVAEDPEHPFVVKTEGSIIKVLGTKFNVRTGSITGNVRVAVVEGKVALKSKGAVNAASALLTRNYVGTLQLSDRQITIEKVNAKNYLSWIHNRLVFSGESLAQVSHQLEHLYNIKIHFKNERLKQLKLTADIEETNLQEVLTIISNTFEINFTLKGDKVMWME
ncbi:MAG TPA: FecR domain-containing protein [Balneolaceae bacterium]